jgi:hypothetical protein
MLLQSIPELEEFFHSVSVNTEAGNAFSSADQLLDFIKNFLISAISKEHPDFVDARSEAEQKDQFFSLCFIEK